MACSHLMIALGLVCLTISPSLCLFEEAEPGDVCDGEADCFRDHSVCEYHSPCTTGMCTCETGYGMETDTATGDIYCVEEVEVGAACGATVGSCPENGYCDSSDVCVCDTNFAESADHMMCEPDRLVGESCLDSDECMGYEDDAVSPVECEAYECTCHEGFHANTANTSCDKDTVVASHGDSCLNDPCDPDVVGLYCDSSDHCACPSGESVVSLYIDGEALEGCIDEAAGDTYDEPEGDECDETSSVAGDLHYCETGNMCMACPGESLKICIDETESTVPDNGASGLTFTLSTLFAMLAARFL